MRFHITKPLLFIVSLSISCCGKSQVTHLSSDSVAGEVVFSSCFNTESESIITESTEITPSLTNIDSSDEFISSSAGLDSSYGKEPLLDSDCESFIFFTDPHLFLSNSDYDVNNEWFSNNMPLFEGVMSSTESSFLFCGGDLLNAGDTIEQAKYKLSYFSNAFNDAFDNFYLAVGNHDTNYQGNTYIESGDSNSCMLSQEELNDALFGGKKAYYSFDIKKTKNYCFDSGLDWDSYDMNDYRWEQIDWFATDLIFNYLPHITLFIHIALINYDYILSLFMRYLGEIVSAFNSRESINLKGKIYDYSQCVGHIDFFQAGHFHMDVNNCTCGGIPVIITDSFCSSDGNGSPTFDWVFVDYDNSYVKCTRYGNGADRVFSI